MKYINEAVQDQITLNEDDVLAGYLVSKPFEMTIDDVEDFRQSITTKAKASSEDKFSFRIGKLVRQKLAFIKGESINYPILPSKGEASATLLLKHISDLNQVDSSIQKAFDQLCIVEFAPELRATAEAISQA